MFKRNRYVKKSKNKIGGQFNGLAGISLLSIKNTSFILGPFSSQLYVSSLTFAETSFNLSFRVIRSFKRMSRKKKDKLGDFRAMNMYLHTIWVFPGKKNKMDGENNGKPAIKNG